MRYQSLSKLEKAYWYSFSDEPIATRNAFTPRLCDPAYLLPEESPDGLWHLFAHTWVGIDHFTSTSGLEWTREHRVFTRAHSPFIFREGTTYYLLYEIHDRDFFNKEKDRLKNSRIMITSSTDLALWSEPKLLLDTDKIPEAVFQEGAARISRPQLVFWEGRYRLYFGAGETRIYDTGQKATARLMYAESDYIEGPYRINHDALLEIEPDSEYRNRAVGSVRIVPCSDGMAGLECAYYYDRERNKSTSAILLLTSEDGLSWSEPKLVQKSPEEGWSSRYISSVDLRYKENEDTWYCYYSANSVIKEKHLVYVKESLGLLLGKDS